MAYLDESTARVSAKTSDTNTINSRIRVICDRIHHLDNSLEEVLCRIRNPEPLSDSEQRELSTIQDYLSQLESNLADVEKKAGELQEIL